MNGKEKAEDQINRVDKRIDALSRRAARQFGFAIFVLVAGVVLMIAIAHQLASTVMNRLDSISPQQAGQSKPNADLDSSRLQALEGRLTSLEILQEAMVSASKSALEQMNFVFAIVAGFFGLFALYFAYRQLMTDSTRDTNDQEMRGLVGSFRENMNVINSLIVTMEKGFEHRAAVDRQISRIESNLKEVEKFKDDTERSLTERVGELNREAWALFGSLNRENFKDETNRGRLSNFYVSMSAIERIGDVQSSLTPFSHFIRALHFFNVTQYPIASKDLEHARNLGMRHAAEPPMPLYAGAGEPEVRNRLEQLLTECCYHLGIIYYNLGSYDRAKDRFTEAYDRDPSDLRSRAYIPELMFFEGRQSFGAVMDEFDSVEREFKAWLTKEGRGKVNLDGNLAALLMRKGNCYLPKAIALPYRNNYRIDENSDLALRMYSKALEHAKRTISDAAKPPLSEIFVRFSLAQAMTEAQQETFDGTTREGLFTEVFYDLRKQVSLKTEPIVLALLNYALALCVSEVEISGENPGFYLSRAREHFTRVPPEVRVFSPINKINLAREEILAEIDEFEHSARRKYVAQA
jgi:tetratricopeptide (TPR) repeat protein